MSYSSEVLADSPLAYYRLGEASGTTMVDSSGNGRDGVYTDVTLAIPGLLVGDSDTAGSFNGSTSVAVVESAAWMEVGTAFSIVAWIKTTSARYQQIASRDDSTGLRVFQFRTSSNGTQLEFVKISNGVATAATSGLTLNDGNVHQVVTTYDGAAIRLYVDGVLEKTQAATGLLTGDNRFRIGSRGNPPGADYFDGIIDEVAFYGTVLSDADVAADYVAGTTVAAPAGTLAASLPVATADLSGTYVHPPISGGMDTVLPVVAASLAGTYTQPDITGSFAVTLPSPTVAFSTATTFPDATGTLDAVLPTLLDAVLLVGDYDPPLATPPTTYTAAYEVEKSIAYPAPVFEEA